ncbi:PDZ domain-containing protein [Ferrimonas pelagia]|uniref:PDZ domain-containing protein n=1 Tax=Ferrimonas pelagia TaxID=1177826 RepID=A0ABP9ESR8_9GAMM
MCPLPSRAAKLPHAASQGLILLLGIALGIGGLWGWQRLEQDVAPLYHTAMPPLTTASEAQLNRLSPAQRLQGLLDAQAELRAQAQAKQALIQEIDWLLAMAKAARQGDSRAHLALASQRPASASQNATPHSPPQPADAKVAAPKTAAVEQAKQQVSAIQQQDLALQKQALAEGWAGSDRLVQARRALWQQARRDLPEHAYSAALFQAKLPNRLFVNSVRAGSSAAENGLRRDDQLIAVDGSTVFTRQELASLLADRPAAPVVLTIERQQQRLTIQVDDLNREVDFYGRSQPPKPISHSANQPSDPLS